MTTWQTTTAKRRVTLADKLRDYVCVGCGKRLAKKSGRAVCPRSCNEGICTTAEYDEAADKAARRWLAAQPLPTISAEKQKQHLASLFQDK